MDILLGFQKAQKRSKPVVYAWSVRFKEFQCIVTAKYLAFCSPGNEIFLGYLIKRASLGGSLVDFSSFSLADGFWNYHVGRLLMYTNDLENILISSDVDPAFIWRFYCFCELTCFKTCVFDILSLFSGHTWYVFRNSGKI